MMLSAWASRDSDLLHVSDKNSLWRMLSFKSFFWLNIPLVWLHVPFRVKHNYFWSQQAFKHRNNFISVIFQTDQVWCFSWQSFTTHHWTCQPCMTSLTPYREMKILVQNVDMTGNMHSLEKRWASKHGFQGSLKNQFINISLEDY